MKNENGKHQFVFKTTDAVYVAYYTHLDKLIATLKHERHELACFLAHTDYIGYMACREEFLNIHDRRYQNSCKYLQEMKAIESLVEFRLNSILYLSKVFFEKDIKSADIATYELNGRFVKLVRLESFGQKRRWAIYLPPLSKL